MLRHQILVCTKPCLRLEACFRPRQAIDPPVAVYLDQMANHLAEIVVIIILRAVKDRMLHLIDRHHIFIRQHKALLHLGNDGFPHRGLILDIQKAVKCIRSDQLIDPPLSLAVRCIAMGEMDQRCQDHAVTAAGLRLCKGAADNAASVVPR